MDKTKLTHTQKHLTFVFTGVTFCIILLIAGSFLVARYYNETRIQKKEFQIQLNLIVR